MSRLRELLAEAAESLSRAGVSSPQVDAEELAAHLLGSRGHSCALPRPRRTFRGDIEIWWHSARGIPLQHLVGSAAFEIPSECAWARGVHSTS